MDGMFVFATRLSLWPLFWGFSLAACSSSPAGSPASGPRSPSSTPDSSANASPALRVVYGATFTGVDPSKQTITLLSDGGHKFRITFTPPGYEDFVVSDGVREVDSIQGELEYASSMNQTESFRIHAADLPRLCLSAKRTGSIVVLGHAADHYTCKPASSDGNSELTIETGSGLLLAARAGGATIAATRIELNAKIPAGSFDLPAVPDPGATQGLLDSTSSGVPDARNAATAVERCRTEANGVLPKAIPATKGPKVTLQCGKAVESFAITPGNTVEYQPRGKDYSIVVSLSGGGEIDYDSAKCPGAPLCISE